MRGVQTGQLEGIEPEHCARLGLSLVRLVTSLVLPLIIPLVFEVLYGLHYSANLVRGGATT